mgnify:CR=1 FL=1
MERLKIPQSVHASVREAARRAFPENASGSHAGHGNHVHGFDERSDAYHSAEHVRMQPEEAAAAVKETRPTGQRMRTTLHRQRETPPCRFEVDLKLAQISDGVHLIVPVTLSEEGTLADCRGTAACRNRLRLR